MSLFTYFYHKILATLLRAIVWLAGDRPRAYPDEVRHIPSRDSGRSIKVHVYHAASTSGPSPVLLNFHGSGFLLRMHGSDHEFCRQISEQTKYTVLDDAIKYALGRPDEFDLSRLSLSGFSAGGNLALAASATLTDAATKVAPDPKGRVIPVPIARLFNRCYVPPTFDARDPRISPRFASLDRFPRRMLMITCEGDSLAPEGEELAEKLQHEGHYVVSERMNGCNHAWDKRARAGTPQRQAKERAYKLAVEMLNE
ncbi:uncharacterized protein N7477_006900 [Penicillium maclennaniae]|uniref:uncharacterized protein n=1 Tax=Penicillium maclennaniae TaxID=1343394 RepID=UPI002540D1E0|nr:uncharacterized protein N7477_006900 [Penicillium maclennaniae]KAJ5668330.1 hypothetical protein N7477_006900 [Penicillium maclennaniae]